MHHSRGFLNLMLLIAGTVLGIGAASAGVAEIAWRPPADFGACHPAKPHATGLSEYRIESAGRVRKFLLYVPRSYTGTEAVPVIVDLQASGISPEVELQITEFDKAAESGGFIVVLPEAIEAFPGGGSTWSIPFKEGGMDDVAFIDDVLDVVNEALCIDARRVYAAGFSGGARFASELACRLPHRFAAISAVGGLRHPLGKEGECQSDRRGVAVIAFHSVDDPINPYVHEPASSPPYWTYGVEEAVKRWADRMTCGIPADEHLSASVRKLTYSECKDGAAIELYRLTGSGHTWPGSDFQFPDYLGETERTTHATALSVRFFERFRLVRD
jgi:polyhydroxybutyrate depolymerase